MLIRAFISWWYGEGWRTITVGIKTRIRGAYQGFSIPILLRTLFEPWKRIITYPGATLQAKMQAVLDNLISRLVGFTMRSLALMAGTVLIVGQFLGGILLIGLWPVLPLAAVALIVAGFLL